VAYFTSYFGSYFATGSGSSLPAGSVRKTSVFGVLQGYGVFRRNAARQRLYWETTPAVEPPVEQPEPVQEDRPAGGFGWSNLYTLELRRRLRRKLRDEENRETVRAALSVDTPPEMVRHFVHQYAPTPRVARAIDYAKRAKSEDAYRRAIAEMARQIEDEELMLVLAVVGLA
jgi:hypothetical protein